ncbi:MAG TPA: flagellar hook-associated protein FlgK [Pirellulales bacterium]|nr:flagellar hook-associated protein FlgK [Pirellulales bacterium]
MSLFGSLQLASNAMQAQQIGLQVVGQNMANANTPGYSREEVQLAPAPDQQLGHLTLGLGVQVNGVTQVVDQYLNERLRGTNSDVSNSQTQAQAYQNLETIVGALDQNNLQSSLSSFFSAISGVLNQPESVSVRNLAVLQGKTLAGAVNQTSQRVSNARSDLNNQVIGMTSDINRLVTDVAKLNVEITSTEGGDASSSQAVGLREQRNQDLTDLSKLIGIKTEAQPSGAVNVYVGGDYLVFEGTSRQVQTAYTTDRGLSAAHINLIDTNAPLDTQTGQLTGLLTARDQILGGFLDNLNQFASTLNFEFNKVYSSGQGLTGFQSMTSTNPVKSASAPLDNAGLPFTPASGAFQVQMLNTQTGLTQTTTINVDLNGLDQNETSLNGLVSQFNAVNGLSASIDASGNLTLKTTSPDLQFSFANDNSGALAALGLNTFFTGSTAADLGVNQNLVNDPGKFAASTAGVGIDAGNATTLANFMNQPLASAGGTTLSDLYNTMVGDVTQGSSVAQSVAQGYQTFQQTLQGQQSAVSGVSIDEETVKMLAYQRAYEASAKLISTINDLLKTLMQL